MEELIEYILQFGNLNTQQINLIKSKVTERALLKDDYFSEAGKIPKEVAFVVEGVFRACYYDREGEEVTRGFLCENSLMSDYMNFESNSTSAEYFQACTDAKIIIFSKQNWEELSEIIVGWDAIKGKMIQSCMFQKNRKNPVVSQNATTRYLEFLENFPNLINRVPLSYIASYLGVTQPSLSRVRKNIR